jgi:hypothetical protein
MTSQFRQDVLAPPVSTMHDIIFDYWGPQVPKESKFEGSGVSDRTLRRASTKKVHAIAGKNSDTVR